MLDDIEFRSLDDSWQREVEEELQPGEELIWAGKPNPSLFVRKSLPIAGIGVWVGAFGALWICGAAGFQIPEHFIFMIFPLLGTPIIAISLFLLTAPIWLPISAKHYVYAVTNKRVITITGWRQRTVISYGPEKLEQIERRQNPDGSGDLLFNSSTSEEEKKGRPLLPPGFHGIGEVRSVERMVRELLERSQRPKDEDE